MTDGTTQGEAVSSRFGEAGEGLTADELLAHEQATAGDGAPPDGGVTVEQMAAAVGRYIDAGVARAMAPLDGQEIVTAAALKGCLRALLRHLHQDHPENYLTPEA